MRADELWNKYKSACDVTSDEYEAWAFGDSPDKLLELVLKGIKVGTASAYILYEMEGEDVPKVGEYSVLLDSKDEAKCIIKTTKVSIVPFKDVDEDHARKEGEGDLSLAYWREVHETFFKICLNEVGLSFDENMLVVCEEFEIVYR